MNSIGIMMFRYCEKAEQTHENMFRFWSLGPRGMFSFLADMFRFLTKS